MEIIREVEGDSVGWKRRDIESKCGTRIWGGYEIRLERVFLRGWILKDNGLIRKSF